MKLKIFDTHAHLSPEPFGDDVDVDAVVERIERNVFPDGFTPEGLDGNAVELAGVLLPGVDVASSRAGIRLAARLPKLHVGVAVHPNSVVDAGPEDWAEIVALAETDPVAAIGETGLDRHWDRTPFDRQLDFFRRHLDLARRTRKPALIHCRDAWDDLLPVLREYEGVPGVIHAFSGDVVQAEESVRLGFFVSFAGSLTYRNAKFAPLGEAATAVPADRLLIETDSPYMVPHPFRGKLRHNEPMLSAAVALRLAELRGESLESICETTTRNAFRLLQRPR